jgi:hypothetical protein
MTDRYVTLDVAATIAGVQKRTIYKWMREGRLTRHMQGFLLTEILAAEKSRGLDALLKRAGIKRADYDAATSEPDGA